MDRIMGYEIFFKKLLGYIILSSMFPGSGMQNVLEKSKIFRSLNSQKVNPCKIKKQKIHLKK